MKAICPQIPLTEKARHLGYSKLALLGLKVWDELIEAGVRMRDQNSGRVGGGEKKTTFA